MNFTGKSFSVLWVHLSVKRGGKIWSENTVLLARRLENCLAPERLNRFPALLMLL
jgi:hypothetical protein